LGQLLVIVTAGIDLSVGSILGFSCVIAAFMLKAGVPAWLSVLAAIAVGTALGTVNGLMLTRLRLPHPFIPTLGMMNVARGLAFVISGGFPISGLPDDFRWIGAGKIAFIPAPVLVVLIVCVVLHLFLNRTAVGRDIYAIGGNPDAARLSGMPITRRLVTVYALSGLLSGFAALVVIARINAADSGVGEDLLLPAIAAVCLGGTSLFGGIGGIMGTAVGAIILALIVNGMNLLGVHTFWQNGVMGTIILISVSADQFSGTRLVRDQ